LRDIEEKEICKLYKALDKAKGEVRKIEESIIEMEQDDNDEKGPWTLNWYEEESKMDELRDEYREDRKIKTAEEALEDLKRKMEKEKDNDDDSLSGKIPLTRL